METMQDRKECVAHQRAQKCNSITSGESETKRRGRRAAERPSGKHLEILAATRTQTYGQVGSTFGVSRQRVGQVVRRWKQYSPVRPLPSREVNSIKKANHSKIKKENSIHIVCFRLTDSEVQSLQSRFPEMKSASRAARNIVRKILSM
jgi:hypothetical protein